MAGAWEKIRQHGPQKVPGTLAQRRPAAKLSAHSMRDVTVEWHRKAAPAV